MTIRNVTQAKVELSALLVRVEAGEDVIISRAGKPIAKLVAYKPSQEPRKPGRLRGKIWIAVGFDEWPDDLDAMFYGNNSSVR